MVRQMIAMCVGNEVFQQATSHAVFTYKDNYTTVLAPAPPHIALAITIYHFNDQYEISLYQKH